MAKRKPRTRYCELCGLPLPASNGRGRPRMFHPKCKRVNDLMGWLVKEVEDLTSGRFGEIDQLADGRVNTGKSHDAHINSMNMSGQQCLIRQIDSGWRNDPGHHVGRPIEIVAIVRRAIGTVRDGQRRLPTSSCPPTALRIVRRIGRHVAHVDDAQVGDIDAKLHGWRAIQRIDFSLAERFLTRLAVGVADLTGVFCTME